MQCNGSRVLRISHTQNLTLGDEVAQATANRPGIDCTEQSEVWRKGVDDDRNQNKEMDSNSKQKHARRC